MIGKLAELQRLRSRIGELRRPEFRAQYPTPGHLARALQPSTRQTPALDAIDEALVDLANAPGATGRTMIFVPPQEGKALALDTPIATPQGWTTMGALRVGDQVFDRHGKTCRVTWVSPIWHDRECYEVRTGDGERIVADAVHEWPARLDRRSGEYLHESSSLASPRSKNAQIVAPSGLDLPDAELPLDPYVLGAWLGDGHARSARMTFADEEIAERIRDAGVPIRKVPTTTYGWSLVPEGWASTRTSPIRVTLTAMGVWGNKHIPAPYFRGSDKQRLSLLQGLIDTDGYVSPRGQVEFTSTNPLLAEGVRELVYSLGAKATITESRATLAGKDCGPKWRVKFYLSGAAHIARKADRCKDSSVARVRYVTAARTESVPTVCIEVDSPDHTFLAGRSLLPTHNSTRTSCWFPLWLLAQDPTLRIAIVSYSATKAERWGRWIRRMIESHPELGIELMGDRKAVDDFETTAGGRVLSVGIGGGITGEPVDVMVIDDPLRGRAEAESPTYREAAWDWWESNGSTRLSSRGRVVLMLTRWHSDDLAGKLVKNEPGKWKVLRIPAVRDRAQPLVRGSDGASAYAPNGELISVQGREPGFFLDLKETRSSYVWNSIYMQTPVAAEGNLFSRTDFRYWQWAESDPSHHDPLHGAKLSIDGVALFIADMVRFVTMDLAESTKRSADWTVASVWAIDLSGRLILLDTKRMRVAEKDHADFLAPLCTRWATPDVYVERGFIGTALVRDATQAGIRIQPLNPSTDKVTRAIPASNRLKAHQVFWPDYVDWLDEWCDEIAGFPTWQYDDRTDTFSYAAHIAAAHWTPPPKHPPRAIATRTDADRAYQAATGLTGEVDLSRAEW